MLADLRPVFLIEENRDIFEQGGEVWREREGGREKKEEARA